MGDVHINSTKAPRNMGAIVKINPITPDRPHASLFTTRNPTRPRRPGETRKNLPPKGSSDGGELGRPIARDDKNGHAQSARGIKRDPLLRKAIYRLCIAKPVLKMFTVHIEIRNTNKWETLNNALCPKNDYRVGKKSCVKSGKI